MLLMVYQRRIALVSALGFFVLALDVASGHFADQIVEHRAQVPGAMAPIFCSVLLLLAAAVSLKSTRWFRRMTCASGVMSILTGAAGAWFHAARFFADLDGEFTWEAMLETLSVSPPLLAPLTFVGVGAVLVMMASGRYKLSVLPQHYEQATSKDAA